MLWLIGKGEKEHFTVQANESSGARVNDILGALQKEIKQISQQFKQ